MKYMARAFICAFFGVISITGQADDMATTSASKLYREVQDVGEAVFTAPDYKPGIVRHIVLFRYQKDVTAKERRDITQRFLALQKSSVRHGQPYIVSIETGTQHSGEGVDQNLEQAFVVTFRSQGDRNYYVGQPLVNDVNHFDPVHHQFKVLVGPWLAVWGVVVFDYTVEQVAE